jgi:hypothetical protein
LAEADAKKLDVVAKALRERPGLHLEIEGGFDDAVDEASLREQNLAQHIRSEKWKESRKTGEGSTPPEEFVVSPEDESRFIRKFYKEEFEPKPPTPTEATDKPAPPPKRRWFIFRLFSHSSPPPPPKPAPTDLKAAASAAPKEPELSEAEMRERLLKGVPLDDNALRQLAADRAARVKQYLIDQGQVPPDRVAVVTNTVAKGTKVNLQLK